MNARPQARCGTPSGANRHRRLGEPVCDACRNAKNAINLTYKRSDPKDEDIAWPTDRWERVGLILRPTGPRPVDITQAEAGGAGPQPIRHGTDTGYGIHRKRGEDACDECKRAHREVYHASQARKKALA